MSEPVEAASGVGQADYMKLFMQELTYQDPLKPVDNREFMAQMAQFSALQQAVTTSQNLTELLAATYDNRAISLLGKRIRVAGVDDYATVEAVYLNENKVTEIRVKTDGGAQLSVSSKQITEIL